MKASRCLGEISSGIELLRILRSESFIDTRCDDMPAVARQPTVFFTSFIFEIGIRCGMKNWQMINVSPSISYQHPKINTTMRMEGRRPKIRVSHHGEPIDTANIVANHKTNTAQTHQSILDLYIVFVSIYDFESLVFAKIVSFRRNKLINNNKIGLVITTKPILGDYDSHRG